MYNIAYVTSSRADYGIVRNYLKLLNNDKNINLEILVTGSLLEEKYGLGFHLIEEDGLNITHKIKVEQKDTSNQSIINNMAETLKLFGECFTINKYDLVIILGDRYEMLSVAISAAMNRIKLLHLHGGEITLGNYDEFIRHSITKMSMYHFTSTDAYRNRVIQLGESPNRVYNIGAMGSENCRNIDMHNVDISKFPFIDSPFFVILFHPETLTNNSPDKQIKTLLETIKSYIDKYYFVFIGTNSDTGSDTIRNAINIFVKKQPKAFYFENLHPDAYHYLLKNSIALVGNSSSGIIEAPSLGCYTINIGDRQKGRIKGTSIIDTECTINDIINSLNRVINLPKKDFFENPYYQVKSSQKAYMITKEILNQKDDYIKDFFDLSE